MYLPSLLKPAGPSLTHCSGFHCKSLSSPFFFSFLQRKRREGERERKEKKKKKEKPWFKLAIAPSFWLWATLSCAKYTVSSSSPTTNQSRHTKAVKKEWWRKILDSPPPPPPSLFLLLPSPSFIPQQWPPACQYCKWYWDLQPQTLLTASLQCRRLCLSVLTEHCKGEVSFYYSCHFYLIADVWKKWHINSWQIHNFWKRPILSANPHHCVVSQLTKSTFPNRHLKRFDIIYLYSTLLKKKIGKRLPNS